MLKWWRMRIYNKYFNRVRKRLQISGKFHGAFLRQPLHNNGKGSIRLPNRTWANHGYILQVNKWKGWKQYCSSIWLYWWKFSKNILYQNPLEWNFALFWSNICRSLYFKYWNIFCGCSTFSSHGHNLFHKNFSPTFWWL